MGRKFIYEQERERQYLEDADSRAEDAQLRALGLDEESQRQNDPEWWVEKGNWSND